MTAKPFLTASSAVSLVGRAQSLFRRQALTASTKAALGVTRMGLASVSCSAWKITAVAAMAAAWGESDDGSSAGTHTDG